MDRIGFIGAGNMGYSMIKGLAPKINRELLTFYDLNQDKVESIEKELNLESCNNNELLIKKCKYIILAVKPQYYVEVMNSIKEFTSEDKVIITIAPGFTIEKTKYYLGNNTRVVRAMPNVPALVGAGVTVISTSGSNFSDEEWEIINMIFQSIGKVYNVDEKLMDAVVPISGSSPAYIFMLIEAMADGGVSLGLPRELSYELAAGTVFGSAKMVLETKKHPGELKDSVCSPGGTTIEAVATLEANGFRSSVIKAMKDCYNKIGKL